MQFLSRFSKSRDATKNHRRHSTPPPKTQSQVASSYLPLSLPSSSLLRDESLAIPLGTTSEDASDDVTEPWVEVAHGGDASSPIKPRPTDLGTTGVERTSARAEDPIKKRREVIKLERSRVPIEQMITLMDECGDVIRTRGLTTLGIFRPYRLSESPSEIRQLCLLFLDYCAEFDLRVPPSSTRGTRASKTVKLHRFKEELRYTEIHNVVAVLKWGLRHFSSTAPFALSSSSPFDFYRSYLASTSAASHPRSSFSRFLLPLLPPESRALLVSCLRTIQAVSSYSEVNAMTCRRLCRTIGYYLFRSEFGGEPGRERGKGNEYGHDFEDGEAHWQRLYRQWRQSGEVLEGLVKSYLWEQEGLPPRLQELAADFPKFVERAMTGSGDHKGARKISVLVVEMESKGEGWDRVGRDRGDGVNDQDTGYVAPASASGRGGVRGEQRTAFARRNPLEILKDAFEAEIVVDDSGGRDRGEAWKLVRDRGRDASFREIFDEETVRVLDLLELTSPSSSSSSKEEEESTRRATSSGNRSDWAPHRRVTSGPNDSRQNGLGNFPNKSVSHLAPINREHHARQDKRIATPSWNEFAQSGFSNETPDLEVGEFEESSDASTMPLSRARRDRSKVIKVDLAVVEEEFSETWIDTLVEMTTNSSPVSDLPSIVIAPLQSTFASSLPLFVATDSDTGRLHLLVCDRLVPLTTSPPASIVERNLTRNSSRKSRPEDVSTLNPRKWTKRASSIFGAAGFRESTSPEPALSAATTTTTTTTAKGPRKSRRSMFAPNLAPLPPPVPTVAVAELPRRASTDPAASPAALEPYSTSPAASIDGGNVITRTLSRTLQRRRSKTSNAGSSPESATDRHLVSSPPRFEAELLEPVPAIPGKYSVEVEEAKRRGSQTSPSLSTAATTRALPDEPRAPLESSDTPSTIAVSDSTLALPASSPETPLKEVLLQGKPILGGTLEPSPPAENNAALADSPTISRAAAIRTPSSEAPSLLLSTVSPARGGSSAPTEPEQLETPQTVARPLDPVASPTFTLSPPEGATQELDSMQEEYESMQDGAERENPSNIGLGLRNVQRPVFELPPEPEQGLADGKESISSPGTILAAPHSPYLISPPANPDSPTVPASPSPSDHSQASSHSRKFLSRTRSFLSRKKSSSALSSVERNKDKERKAETKRDKELLRTRQLDGVRDSPRKERKVPTPVSSVKKRVAELEAAASASLPPTPTTASRINNKGSDVPPPWSSRVAPDSPTPLPTSMSQPGSAASSIVPLPDFERPQGAPDEVTEALDGTTRPSDPLPSRPASATQVESDDEEEEKRHSEIGLSPVGHEAPLGDVRSKEALVVPGGEDNGPLSPREEHQVAVDSVVMPLIARAELETQPEEESRAAAPQTLEVLHVDEGPSPIANETSTRVENEAAPSLGVDRASPSLLSPPSTLIHMTTSGDEPVAVDSSERSQLDDPSHSAAAAVTVEGAVGQQDAHHERDSMVDPVTPAEKEQGEARSSANPESTAEQEEADEFASETRLENNDDDDANIGIDSASPREECDGVAAETTPIAPSPERRGPCLIESSSKDTMPFPHEDDGGDDPFVATSSRTAAASDVHEADRQAHDGGGDALESNP